MKSSLFKSGFGTGVLVFVVATIIALPLRTVQYFTSIEGGTGFYTKTGFGVYALYCVLAAAIIAILVLGVIKRKKLDYSVNVEKRTGPGILAITCAAGLMLDLVACLGRAMNLDGNLGISVAASEEMTIASTMIAWAEGIFALISAVYFLLLGLKLISGKSNGSEIKLLSLAPVIWSITRMVCRFMRTISYIQVSDLFFEMLMLVFYIEFFMAFAQVNSRVGYKNSEWKIAAYGLPAALLALVCFVPRFVLMLTGNTSLMYAYSSAEYCDFAIALFVLATVVTRCIDKIDVPVEAEAENAVENSAEDTVADTDGE